MSRYSSNGSYSHRCRVSSVYDDTYEISWVVDYYYPDSKLRYPRTFTKITERKGAIKFCKKHNITLPD